MLVFCSVSLVYAEDIPKLLLSSIEEELEACEPDEYYDCVDFEPETFYIYTLESSIEDGGIFEIDISREYELSFEQVYSFPYYVDGYVYVVDEEGEREYVGNIRNGSILSDFLDVPGEYEIDMYKKGIFLLQEHWWQPIASLLFSNVVYAEDEGEFIGTLHFSLVEKVDESECCSTIVFLPGIKGSVLKSGEDSLWPPSMSVFGSEDVLKLALNDDGTSVNDVVVDGVLNNFYTTSVYQGFTDYANNLVSDGIINEWQPFAYDWRLPFSETLTNGVKTPDGILDIISEIEMLAENSRTGKVSIIAHSMGGLLGKELVQMLDEKGESDLVDSFIMVGSPQLGTPQAIGSLLHGDSEGILKGFIVNSTSARSISKNFETTYDLLPSRTYFEKVSDPVISFSESWFQLFSIDGTWYDYWGESIQNFVELQEFLSGSGVIRTSVYPKNPQVPAVLRSDLLDNADMYHSMYDSYDFPDNIHVVQIAGWVFRQLNLFLIR